MNYNHKQKKILCVTNDGFTSLSGGSIMLRSLLKDYEPGNLLSLDLTDEAALASAVERISIIPNVFGIRLRQYCRALNLNRRNASYGSGVQALASWIIGILIGDASLPTFPLKLRALHRRVKSFAPDIIYTTSGSYAVNRIVLYLSKKLRIPIVLHVMDDWVVAKNNYGLLSLCQGPFIRRSFVDLVRIATLRYGISEGMKLAYEQRYGYRFHVLSTLVEGIWVRKGEAKKNRDVLSIGYVGSFTGLSQSEPIQDLVDVLNQWNGACKYKLTLLVTPATYHHATRYFAGNAAVEIGLAPADDACYYELLRSFDLLLMPSSLSGVAKKYIKYSIPAKFYSYLAAGVVVLYYGDSESEQIRYARENRLGLVVTDRTLNALRSTLQRFAEDWAGAQDYLDRQYDFMRKNHDANSIRQSLYRSLGECLNPEAVAPRIEAKQSYDHHLLCKKRNLLDTLIEKTKPKSILDFGGGTGYTFSRYINDTYPNIDITLFDVSVESLEAATWAGQHIEKVSDPKLLETRQFDLVIASEVVEHVDASDFVLKDIAALVKPDGYVFTTVPNGYGGYEITVMLYRLLVQAIASKRFMSMSCGQTKSTLSTSPHVAFYTYPTLLSAFNCAGLVVENYFPIVLSHFRASRVLSEYFPQAMSWNIDLTPQVNPRWVDDWGFLLTRSDSVKSSGCQDKLKSKLLTRFNIFRTKINRDQ